MNAKRKIVQDLAAKVIINLHEWEEILGCVGGTQDGNYNFKTSFIIVFEN